MAGFIVTVAVLNSPQGLKPAVLLTFAAGLKVPPFQNRGTPTLGLLESCEDGLRVEDNLQARCSLQRSGPFGAGFVMRTRWLSIRTSCHEFFAGSANR